MLSSTPQQHGAVLLEYSSHGSEVIDTATSIRSLQFSTISQLNFKNPLIKEDEIVVETWLPQEILEPYDYRS